MEKDLYFKDEEAKYIFYSVEIGGRIQMDLLGIKRIHYINKETWRFEKTASKRISR